ISWFACRFALGESDLERADKTKLESAFESFDIPVSIGAGTDVDDSQHEREGETFRWLALACGAFLLLELFTAWWFGRR
ncbi:MAG TPA: hypothetical protein VK116_03390, partial [Planctomycetota bacterium]|nr:hypothetical protein [Planctomycetota bacterium]